MGEGRTRGQCSSFKCLDVLFKAHECKMFKGGRFFGWIPLVMNDETREVCINDEMATKKSP